MQSSSDKRNVVDQNELSRALNWLVPAHDDIDIDSESIISEKIKEFESELNDWQDQELQLNPSNLTNIKSARTIILDLLISPPDNKKLILSKLNLRTIPKVIDKIKNLQSIEFDGNEITEVSGFVFELPNLKKLNLKDNKISQIKIAQSLAISIEDLDLSYNRLNEVPEGIEHLKRLNKLNLQFNDIRDLNPDRLIKLKNLKQISISDNNLAEDQKDSLTQNNSSLQILDGNLYNVKSLIGLIEKNSDFNDIELNSDYKRVFEPIDSEDLQDDLISSATEIETLKTRLSKIDNHFSVNLSPLRLRSMRKAANETKNLSDSDKIIDNFIKTMKNFYRISASWEGYKNGEDLKKFSRDLFLIFSTLYEKRNDKQFLASVNSICEDYLGNSNQEEKKLLIVKLKSVIHEDLISEHFPSSLLFERSQDPLLRIEDESFQSDDSQGAIQQMPGRVSIISKKFEEQKEQRKSPDLYLPELVGDASISDVSSNIFPQVYKKSRVEETASTGDSIRPGAKETSNEAENETTLKTDIQTSPRTNEIAVSDLDLPKENSPEGKVSASESRGSDSENNTLDDDLIRTDKQETAIKAENETSFDSQASPILNKLNLTKEVLAAEKNESIKTPRSINEEKSGSSKLTPRSINEEKNQSSRLTPRSITEERNGSSRLTPRLTTNRLLSAFDEEFPTSLAAKKDEIQTSEAKIENTVYDAAQQKEKGSVDLISSDSGGAQKPKIKILDPYVPFSDSPKKEQKLTKLSSRRATLPVAVTNENRALLREAPQNQIPQALKMSSTELDRVDGIPNQPRQPGQLTNIGHRDEIHRDEIGSDMPLTIKNTNLDVVPTPQNSANSGEVPSVKPELGLCSRCFALLRPRAKTNAII